MKLEVQPTPRGELMSNFVPARNWNRTNANTKMLSI